MSELILLKNERIPRHNLTGKRFGKWTVISLVSHIGKAKWNCICDCGRSGQILSNSLLRGRSLSCKHCVNYSHIHKIHGHTSRSSKPTNTYISWDCMIQRCTNTNNVAYHNYGGRGITICDEWLDFKNFLRDMGERPSGKTLDRIDNNKGYDITNCRWATKSEQELNKR